jgi:drug/metabolite transporter (DMT)-like permease
MPIEAIVAALLSAVIHASWNATLKSGGDRFADLAIMGLGAMLLGVAIIAWRGIPPAAAWPFLLGSSLVHIVYWTALNRGYASGDLSHVYTIARGLAPLLVALGGALWAGEYPSPAGLAGILLVSLGIAAIGLTRHASPAATLWAGLTGVTIAIYSLLDALGARASGDAITYMGFSSFASFLPATVFGLWRRGIKPLYNQARGRALQLLAAGAITMFGFGLALWAQTIAPIAHITALRETSVVFGTAIAAVFLREPVGRRRWLGAVIVAGGAILLASGGRA